MMDHGRGETEKAYLRFFFAYAEILQEEAAIVKSRGLFSPGCAFASLS
jgi:hypothetical protein